MRRSSRDSQTARPGTRGTRTEVNTSVNELKRIFIERRNSEISMKTKFERRYEKSIKEKLTFDNLV